MDLDGTAWDFVEFHEPHDTANLGHLANPNGRDDAIYDNITNHNIPIGAN